MNDKVKMILIKIIIIILMTEITMIKHDNKNLYATSHSINSSNNYNICDVINSNKKIKAVVIVEVE